LGFDLYDTDREWSELYRKTRGGAVKTGFPLSYSNNIFLIYRYENKEIYDVDDGSIYIDQEGKSTLSSIYASFTRNTTDFRPDPSRGYVSELSVEYAGLGGTEKFVKYIADHRHFFRLMWGTVLSIRGQMGYLQAIDGETPPIDERFFLGGLHNVRGFKARRLGPEVHHIGQYVDPATGEVTATYNDDYEHIGGDKEAFLNVEYIFPLIPEAGMKGVVFFDIGNAWAEHEDFFETRLRYSVGAGIRWFSPLGPLRLEWGFNLDRKDRESKTEFEFSIGRFY